MYLIGIKIALLKGTIGEDLARFYHTELLKVPEKIEKVLENKDKIKEILGDTIGFANREENLKLSKATMELMTYGFIEMAKLGKDLILEANFKEGEMEKIHIIASEKEYRMLTLNITADMEIIYKRFVNRIENENRHPVHICGFDGYESFNYYIDLGRKQRTFGKTILVNANDFSYQTDDYLIGIIDEFMGDKNEND